MGKPVPPFVTPIVGQDGLVRADPWQKYFTNLYAEGLWTPILGGSSSTSGQTYTAQAGRYIKVGRQVTLTAQIGLSAKGTLGGNIVISPLPFRSEKHTSGIPYWLGTALYSNLATSWSSLAVLLTPDMVAAFLYGTPAGGATSQAFLTTADIGNSTGIVVTLSYLSQV
jgi:hypothetical protein